MIVFHALTDGRTAAIVELLLADLKRRLATQDLILELTPAARALIAREGHDPSFGARPLKRTIQRLVENPLARALLEGRVQAGHTIRVDADPVGGTLVFSADGRPPSPWRPPSDGMPGPGRERALAAGRAAATVLDLPDTEAPPGRDGGELVN